MTGSINSTTEFKNFGEALQYFSDNIQDRVLNKSKIYKPSTFQYSFAFESSLKAAANGFKILHGADAVFKGVFGTCCVTVITYAVKHLVDQGICRKIWFAVPLILAGGVVYMTVSAYKLSQKYSRIEAILKDFLKIVKQPLSQARNEEFKKVFDDKKMKEITELQKGATDGSGMDFFLKVYNNENCQKLSEQLSSLDTILNKLSYAQNVIWPTDSDRVFEQVLVSKVEKQSDQLKLAMGFALVDLCCKSVPTEPTKEALALRDAEKNNPDSLYRYFASNYEAALKSGIDLFADYQKIKPEKVNSKTEKRPAKTQDQKKQEMLDILTSAAELRSAANKVLWAASRTL